MTTRADVLAFFDRRERAALVRGLAVYEVAHEFRLSMRLAARHVLGLWQALLIEPTVARRRGLRTRLAEHEHLEDIRFRLTETRAQAAGLLPGRLAVRSAPARVSG